MIENQLGELIKKKIFAQRMRNVYVKIRKKRIREEATTLRGFWFL